MKFNIMAASSANSFHIRSLLGISKRASDAQATSLVATPSRHTMSVVGDENWILVEWGNKSYGVVESCKLVNADAKTLSNGCPVLVRGENDVEVATYLASSTDKSVLEQALRDAEPEVRPDHSKLDTLVKAALADEEPRDYSSSASSWVPSDGDLSESTDTETEDTKKKTKNNNNVSVDRENDNKERSTKKVLTPSNKVNAIVPHCMKKNFEKPNNNKIQKRKLVQNVAQRVVELELKANCEPKVKNMDINMVGVIEMRFLFRDVFRLVRILKNIQGRAGQRQIESERPRELEPVVELPQEVENVEIENQKEHDHDQEPENMDITPSDELDRSDDNVFITNKYDTIENMSHNSENKENEDVYDIQNELQNNTDGVPIGSGDTVVEKDKYIKIKWTSYTMATRGLLLAVFSRRVLATHSLTGKKSPAFQNKPPKMCLDPKKVSDIILEVRKRFNVKENLIRSIITTKCADECKMLRMRMEKTLTPKKNESGPKQPNEIEEDASNTI